MSGVLCCLLNNAQTSSKSYTVETRFNDIGLQKTSCVTSDILCCQIIPHC